MRIAIDIRSLAQPECTGVGEYTRECVRALVQKKMDHKIYLFYSGLRTLHLPFVLPTGVELIHTKWPNKLFHALVFLRLICVDRHIEKRMKDPQKKLDVFFSPNSHFTHVSNHVRVALTIHDLASVLYPETFSLKRRLWHSLLGVKKQVHRADIIFTPSEHTKRDVCRVFSIAKEKVHVAYPGVSDLFLDTTPGLQKEQALVQEKYSLQFPYIFFLGTLEPRKNVGTLIDAFVLSGLREKGYTLLLAGGTGWKSRGLLQKINQTIGVRYIGYVARQEKRALYSLARVSVYPSTYEGFGFPPLEAASCSTAVVASNVSSLPEVLGGGAYLVNPQSVADLATGIVRVAEDDTLRELLIQKGKAVAAGYRWQRMVGEVVRVLERRPE